MAEKKESIELNHDDEEIINWEEEARAIINDVKMHVAIIEVAKGIPSSDSHIYLNVKTFENAEYCVQVSALGFRVVGNQFNTIDENENLNDKQSDDEVEVFETPYALLDKISPSYVQSFGNQLVKQLQNLEQMQVPFNEDDELQEEEDEVSENTK